MNIYLLSTLVPIRYQSYPPCNDNFFRTHFFIHAHFSKHFIFFFISGNTFEYFLEKGTIQSHITILGATSGDTGSAALYGLRGKKNVNCFIMYPKGKVTDIQERQMTSILDSNVHCISIDVSTVMTRFVIRFKLLIY